MEEEINHTMEDAREEALVLDKQAEENAVRGDERSSRRDGGARAGASSVGENA